MLCIIYVFCRSCYTVIVVLFCGTCLCKVVPSLGQSSILIAFLNCIFSVALICDVYFITVMNVSEENGLLHWRLVSLFT